MCVTSGPAKITGTRMYVYATLKGRRICGYQNQAESLAGANCMFLNFAGTDLELVEGPEHTKHLMLSITAQLPELEYVPRFRGASYSGSRNIRVSEYGDYTIVQAQTPKDIFKALKRVREDRRPVRTPAFEKMVRFYMETYPQDSFVLACFNGMVKREHPIVVSYVPRNPEVLTAPGLDGHDGTIPSIGAPIDRDFAVAFGIEGVKLPYEVYYSDEGVAGQSWAPPSVNGFEDNRSKKDTKVRNGDYILSMEDVKLLSGEALAEVLIDPRKMLVK